MKLFAQKDAEEFLKSGATEFRYNRDIRLTPGANNGIGIRAPLTGDAAYAGMEIQVLDDTADQYKALNPYLGLEMQDCGSEVQP